MIARVVRSLFVHGLGLTLVSAVLLILLAPRVGWAQGPGNGSSTDPSQEVGISL